MMEWFNTLQTRERYLLGAAAVVVALVLLYTLVWDPVVSSVSRLEKSVAASQRQLVWMQNASAEIRALQRSSGGSARVQRNVSLITAVESSAKRSGVRQQVTRMEPQGAKKISVELKKVNFDRLISWIEVVARQYGASVAQFSASKTDAPGLVDARLIFTREG